MYTAHMAVSRLQACVRTGPRSSKSFVRSHNAPHVICCAASSTHGSFNVHARPALLHSASSSANGVRRTRNARDDAFRVLAKPMDADAPYGAPYDPTTFEVPTFLNNTPHQRDVRRYFYDDCTDSIVKAVDGGVKRMKAECEIPELNTEMDVYRVGTMLELIRHMANKLAADGKKVRVCVQGSMGKGVFQALPLTLSGVRRIMDLMDWGEDMLDNFIFMGAIGPEEAQPEDDVFILISPTNIVGHSILPPMQKMMDVVGDRPVILFNPRMTDIPSAEGVMQVRGRKERIEFEKSFETSYHFRLLYNKPYHFPIYGAMRKVYGNDWEIYKRSNITKQEEVYTKITKVTLGATEPTPAIITKAIRG